jgi:3-keto-disaccharide hydrolase
MGEDIDSIQELLSIKKKRLHELEKQAAIHGVDTSPHIILEIEALQTGIDQLERKDKAAKRRQIVIQVPASNRHWLWIVLICVVSFCVVVVMLLIARLPSHSPTAIVDTPQTNDRVAPTIMTESPQPTDTMTPSPTDTVPLPTNTALPTFTLDYGQLRYEENFDQDNGQWSLNKGSSIQNGELIIESGAASSPSRNDQYSDFTFETEFRVDPKEPDYDFSVYLRFSPCSGRTQNCSDQIGVSSTGSVFAKLQDGTENIQQLLIPTRASQFNPNGPNKLTVIVEDSKFRIFINKVFVQSFTDSTYKSGTIVLDADGAAIHVNYVRVYSLPN